MLVKQFCCGSGLPHKLFFKVGEMLLMLKKAYIAYLLTLIYNLLFILLFLAVHKWLWVTSFHDLCWSFAQPRFSASFLCTYMRQMCQTGLLLDRELEQQMEFSSWVLPFSVFPREPSMWPSHSMCISTTENAFFGCPSTWLHLVCMLLAAITDMFQCMNMFCLVKWSKYKAHLVAILCIRIHLSLSSARTGTYGLLDRCRGRLWQLEKAFTFPKCWQRFSVRKIMLNCQQGAERGWGGGGGAEGAMGEGQMEWEGGAMVKLERRHPEVLQHRSICFYKHRITQYCRIRSVAAYHCLV